jgi:hypothetical protein
MIGTRTLASSLVLLALVLGACGDSSGPRVGPPTGITPVTGTNQQSGPAGAALATPIAVRVVNAQGGSAAGAAVTFTVLDGNGSVSPVEALTGSDGTARTTWTLGLEAGMTQRVEAAVATATGTARTTFIATALPGPPVALTKVGGDEQGGGSNTALRDSLVVRVTDQYGNGVPGVTVTWSTGGNGTAAPSTSTTDATGRARTRWTLGQTVGTVTMQATAGSLAAVTFSATVQPLPSISSITPALMLPGTTVTLTGIHFDPAIAANTLTVAGVAATVVEANPNLIRATLAAGGYPCVPTGNVGVTLVSGGTTTTRLHPLRATPQRPMAVGAAITGTGADPLHCVDLTATGSRFLVAVTNTNSSITNTASLRLRSVPEASALPAEPAVAAAAARAPLRAPAAAATPQILDRRVRHAREHMMLLDANTRMVEELARSPGMRSAAARARTLDAATTQSVPARNDTLTFRVPRISAGTGQACNVYDEVRARVAYVGTRAIIVEDIANTVKNLDSYYEAMGQDFDARQYQIVRSNFGDPLLLDPTLDNNGRLFMLFTRQVDASRIAGFVWSGDFYDRTVCPQSNMGEIFYGYVPSDASPAYGAGTVGEWFWSIRATVIHEVKHIASFAQRISRGASQGEEQWLEEATAQLSEELWARQVFGYGPGDNVTYAQSVGCEIRGAFNAAPCEGKPSAVFQHFMLLSRWMQQPEQRSPLGRADTDDSSFYGSGWLFLRWALEHSGRAEDVVLRELTQTTERGAANLAARIGLPFGDMVRDWAMAVALDDRPGTTPANARWRINAWDTRSVYSGLNAEQPQIMPTAFPLEPRPLAFMSTTSDVGAIRGGGTAYFELLGTPVPLALEFLAGGGGAPLPAALRVTIYRLQ